MHLAEFNIGTLKYNWEDPRVADFLNNLVRVYDIAYCAPGYVWHWEGDDMEAAQFDPNGPWNGNRRTACTLSVRTDVESLHNFTFNTVHKQFFDRTGESYDPDKVCAL
jgi:uncharacterized protein DUF3291